MEKLLFEIKRLNTEDVIATSGMCQYINPSYTHWRFYDLKEVEDEKMARIDAWRYSETDGWTFSHENDGNYYIVSNYELIYNTNINEGDIYRLGDPSTSEPFVKCNADHSYLFSLENQK